MVNSVKIDKCFTQRTKQPSDLFSAYALQSRFPHGRRHGISKVAVYKHNSNTCLVEGSEVIHCDQTQSLENSLSVISSFSLIRHIEASGKDVTAPTEVYSVCSRCHSLQCIKNILRTARDI